MVDLFAGEGRFGKACLKEGALSVLFVEWDSRQCERLRQIGETVQGDVVRFLERSQTHFDIVFADPPFPYWKGTFGEKLALHVKPRLAESGIFVVKSPRRVLFSHGFHVIKVSKFGESEIHFLES